MYMNFDMAGMQMIYGNPFIEAGVKHIKMIHDSMQKD